MIKLKTDHAKHYDQAKDCDQATDYDQAKDCDQAKRDHSLDLGQSLA
jgi:hypothetical protein